MKIILVDAWNTFVCENGVNIQLQKLLDSFPNKKIILTNANAEEKIKFGIINMPYEVFSLEHNPNKTDPRYYEIMLKYFGLNIEEVVYFEHNIDAVNTAKTVGINTFYYDKDKKDLAGLEKFLINNL
ncbi:MAG: hypothetical protein PHE25_00755 [Candidatus Gracilibacteria bacterium]|nr:hypothetical protein [Candidatus Gracilibacteria bacterium]